MPLLRSYLLALFLVSTIFSSSRNAAAETFKNPQLIPTASTPTNVISADFNSDGMPDLAYLDSSGVCILLGNGNGTFRRVSSISLPQGFGGNITAADLNNDGHVDLLVGYSGPKAQIAALLGNGDGTFGAPIITTLPVAGNYFANMRSQAGVADINGDGALDIIVSDTANGAIYVLIGNNTGSFSLSNVIPNLNSPTTIWTGDFNGDGKRDFVAFGFLSATVTVYLGKGNGTFQAGVDYGGGNNPITSVALADMDGDGHVDIVSGTQSNSIRIFHGNADGTFATTSEGGANLNSYSVVLGVADLNSDGVPDILVSDADGLNVLLGAGNLGFDAPFPYALGASPGTFALADFDRDGHLDLALTAVDGIVLLRGSAQGVFQSFDVYPMGQPVNAIAAGDFNGDRIVDLALAEGAAGPGILLGNGDGTFRVQSTTPSRSGTGGHVLTGDFDGDGKTDLYFSGTNFAGTVMFGNGDGTFSSQVDLSIQQIGYQAAGAADFNKDGRTDLADMNYQSVDVILGQANRSFAVNASAFSSWTLSNLQSNVAPAIGDFNKDGNPDLVIAGITTFQVLLGNGDGTFTPGRTMNTQLPGYTNLVAPVAIATADLDGDGNLDLVIPVSYPSVAEIFYGNGDGTFQYPVVLPLQTGVEQVYIADVNGDHLPDLILTTQGVITIIHNTGNRTFSGETHYVAGLIKALAIQDFNGDGLPDIAVASSGSTVAVLLNQPGGSVTGTFIVQPEPSSTPFSMNLSIAPAYGAAGSPTGTVGFYIDANAVGTVALTGGQSSLTYPSSALAAGTHSILAVYSGDANFAPAYFRAQHKVVGTLTTTTVTLSARPNPVLAGQTVSFQAQVGSPGTGPTAGTVSFLDGSTPLGSVALNGSSLAVFDTALLSSGTHQISAQYLETGFATATSGPVTVIVNALQTSTSLNANPTSVAAGETVLLTAAVTSPQGTPTGSVLFYDGASLLRRAALDSHGTAIYGAAFAATGAHAISAMYSANATFASSNAQQVNVVVVPGGSSSMSVTNLSAAASPQVAEGLILTSTVVGSGGTPTGQVVFWDGNVALGTATLDVGGVGKYQTTSLSLGLHYLAASYAGGSTLSPSASPVITYTVPLTTPDFTIASQASRLLLSGSSTTVALTVRPVNGFQSTVSLSCSTPGQQIRCSFQPQTILGANGVSVLTIQRLEPRAGVAVRLAWLATIVLSFLFVRGDRRIRMLCAIIVCTGFTLACGARRPLVGSDMQTLVITAESPQTATRIVHSLELKVQVKVGQ